MSNVFSQALHSNQDRIFLRWDPFSIGFSRLTNRNTSLYSNSGVLIFVHFSWKGQCARCPMGKGTNDFQMMKIIQYIPEAFEEIHFEREKPVKKSLPNKENCIHPEMTVLDIISSHRETEAVFKQYDEQAGECICCQALFEPLRNVAVKYGLDLKNLITDLEATADL